MTFSEDILTHLQLSPSELRHIKSHYSRGSDFTQDLSCYTSFIACLAIFADGKTPGKSYSDRRLTFICTYISVVASLIKLHQSSGFHIFFSDDYIFIPSAVSRNEAKEIINDGYEKLNSRKDNAPLDYLIDDMVLTGVIPVFRRDDIDPVVFRKLMNGYISKISPKSMATHSLRYISNFMAITSAIQAVGIFTVKKITQKLSKLRLFGPVFDIMHRFVVQPSLYICLIIAGCAFTTKVVEKVLQLKRLPNTTRRATRTTGVSLLGKRTFPPPQTIHTNTLGAATKSLKTMPAN